MSYIPDVRNRMKPRFKNKSPAKKNEYWQGYLNEESALKVLGYDYAAAEVVENFFCDPDNVDIKKDISPADVNLSLSEWFEKYPEAFDELRRNILETLESNRNELVVSCIESMSDDEYEKRVEEADNGKLNSLFCCEFEKDTLENGYINYKE